MAFSFWVILQIYDKSKYAYSIFLISQFYHGLIIAMDLYGRN